MRTPTLATVALCTLALHAASPSAAASNTETPSTADLVSAASPLHPSSQAAFANLRGNKASFEQPLRIAFVPIAPEFSYYATMAEGIEAEAKRAGVEVVTTGPQGSGDNALHVAILEEIIARADVHGLIVTVRDAKLAAPVLRRAVEAGIVVVVANSDLRTFPAPVHAIVGYSQYEANRAMGDFAGHITAGRSTQVGMIPGAPGYHSTQAVIGFRAGLYEHSHMTVVASHSGGWSVEGGRLAAEMLLNLHPDIDLIWAANDNMIMGARKAADAVGRSDLVLLGRDGDPAALRMVAEGRLTATNDTDPAAIGAVSARAVIEALAGRFEGGFVETPTVLIDTTRAASYLAIE